jgi:hypothetical protein
MKKPLISPKKNDARAFTLGRERFAKISAVEGVRLDSKMAGLLDEFDRKDLSPAQRRQAIAGIYGKRTPK